MVRARAAILLALVPLAVRLPSNGVNAAAILPVSPRDITTQALTASDASAPDITSSGVSPVDVAPQEDATADINSFGNGPDLIDPGDSSEPDESLGICNTDTDCSYGQACRNGLCVLPTGEPCRVHRDGCKADVDCCNGTCRWSWRVFTHVCK